MKKRDILREKPSKLFFSYLLPSISSTLVTSIYIFVDTVMIGKGVGEDGIAALNIILPVFGVLYGLGVLFGVGGGVLMSVANGAGNHEEAHGYFSSALVCAVVSSAMCAIVTVIFFEPLMMAMGADSTTYPLVYEYGIYIAYGSPLFLFTNFLQAFVRNDKAPRRAMVGVITGGITNVILDYVFIFPMDMGDGWRVDCNRHRKQRYHCYSADALPEQGEHDAFYDFKGVGFARRVNNKKRSAGVF